MISANKLGPTLIALAEARVCELVADDVIFANAIVNNYKTPKAFENFVKDCRLTFSYRRNTLLGDEISKNQGCLSWDERQRKIRQPHLLYVNRRYPQHVRRYFKMRGFLSHMVREDETV